jgi:acyl-coenzyme A synthetase/AMP-(fatty) acid ligase
VATVKLQEGAEATAEELIAYTRDRLAHVKCPTRIEFVAELPRTVTGKVLKTVLLSSTAEESKQWAAEPFRRLGGGLPHQVAERGRRRLRRSVRS